MNCSGPGATHWMACDCRERKWAERLAGADRALYAERERVVRAELRAASLSCELLDAMQARDRLAERAVTMQLMRDTIEGWATGQPGKMPTAVEDGWSTALSAAVARLAASEKAREAWTETARMHAKNEAYYRDLIVRTLSGTPAAFVSDDGSVQQNVICAKLPELYEASEKAREEADAYAGRANARIADLGERLDATEAVLRDAEKAREEAERERDRAAQIATKEAVIASSALSRATAAESRAARLAEALRESQETLALVLWAHPKGRVTVSDHHRATLPIPWEIVTYLDVDTRATVIGARAAIAAEEGK